MARPIVLSNGELHVGLNNYGLVHDFYYPYVGFENHAAGANLRHKIGVWVDGTISWLDGGQWSFKYDYPHDALIGHIVAKNESLNIVVEFDDCVDATVSAFIRNVHVVNLADTKRDIRLFMHQAFAIGDSRSHTDTAQYLPDSDAILHYRGRRAFVISGTYNDQPFDQHSIGVFGIEGHQGTYKDAEDGELALGNVEHGRVDSVLRFKLEIDPHSSARIHYWIAAGMSVREALYIHKQLQDEGVMKHLYQTADWWKQWLQPAIETSKSLPENHRDSFIKSVMIIKSQIDKRGAVMASTDSSMLNYSKDAYAYSWPRDGAYIMWSLLRIGYKDEIYRYFEFSKRGLHPAGYLMHKYRADGALGSSWHPYVHGDIVAPPIQEDETALTVFVFVQFYLSNPSASLLKDFYGPMVKPMADFLTDHVDENTGLPKPSYDLWEQSFLTTTYTTATTYGALIAAADLAEAADDEDSAVKWRSAADDIKIAAEKHLFNQDKRSFYKGIIASKDGTLTYDDTVDSSSVFGAFMFGLSDADSDEVKQSIDTLLSLFNFKAGESGLPRYEDDDYRRKNPDVTGNWWYITTLWLAQYYADQGDITSTNAILDWVLGHATSSGMFGEQIDPVNGDLVSPAPLTWSHAEYVSTLLDLIPGEAK